MLLLVLIGLNESKADPQNLTDLYLADSRILPGSRYDFCQWPIAAAQLFVDFLTEYREVA